MTSEKLSLLSVPYFCFHVANHAMYVMTSKKLISLLLSVLILCVW